MIGRLTGMLVEVGGETAILDVHGVGYEVHCPARVLGQVSVTDGPVTLIIETVVREDMIRLYGFTDAAEKDWFRLLQVVQGVGARVALAILSILSPDDCAGAIAAQDHAIFARASGVGPKLAKRIVTELKDKAPAGAVTIGSAKLAKPAGGPLADALSALVNLGYSDANAKQAVEAAATELGDGAEVADLIRAGLKRLV